MTNKKTILIIEDESVNRKILNKILQQDYYVVEAENGKAGLDFIMNQRNSVAAILLDVLMPVMDGYEFLKELQEAEITHIPVIVTTGMNDSESEQRLLNAGAWDFVTKPYSVKVLLSRLRNAIARSEVDLYEQMQKMTAHDTLTGLHNRRRMFEQTREMIDSNPDRTFAFLRFDIDHFALFNTSFGEKEGNRLLIFVAECLRKTAKGVELCKYCRMSADVFCVCFAVTGMESEIKKYVDFMQGELKRYKKDYLISLSVGVCIIKDSKLSIDDMYFRATVASKKCKNQYEKHLAFYDVQSGKRIENEFAIQNEMQAALDKEQFNVYLQPKFNIDTNKICGAEALVRWIHPDKGMISPGAFIPVFENNGFISKLDYYVWDKTCQMIRKWLDEGKKIYPVSVNVSRVSLYNPNLTELMTGLMDKYQLDTTYFQIEITESAYMTDPELMKNTIVSLHEAGFTILMDDFGSGYSSLNTLKQIYIDVLKIDMKFLPVEEETGRAEIILTCIIKMAKLLGLTVITEGVETKIQRDFLEGVGCDAIQGYYYSRPIPQSEYETTYLNNNETDDMLVINSNTNNVTESNRMKVLIVDDSEIDREILKQNLQHEYDIYMCDDGEAALAYLKKNMSSVKLILLDNIMPGMTGLEFLNHCRMDTALNAIPKIMITADDKEQDQVEAFKNGAYDYISKPLRKEILIARVNHALEVSSRMLLYDSIDDNEMYFAEHDAATGLINKVVFQEITDRLLQIDSKSNALLVIDIDNFKQVNDKYGHLVGDKVIKCVADELKNAFRKTDIIGRFGGDEFVVLMTQLTNKDIVRKKSEEIIKSVSLACLNQFCINASISIGIAFSNRKDNQETLFTKADQALYKSKRSGKAKSVIYGETVPSVQDDNRPVVLICSDDPQVYPTIALSYGNRVGFVNVNSFDCLKQSIEKYNTRISTICLDMQKRILHDSDDFYQYIINHGGGEKIPILVFYKDGDMKQIKEALDLKVSDIISLPPNMDIVRNKLSAALLKAELCKQ